MRDSQSVNIVPDTEFVIASRAIYYELKTKIHTKKLQFSAY